MLDVQVPKKYVLNSLQWNLKLTFYCKGRQGKMLRLKLDSNLKQMHFSNIIIPNTALSGQVIFGSVQGHGSFSHTGFNFASMSSPGVG